MTDATTAAINEIPFVCSATLQATPQGLGPFKYGGILPMKRECIPDQNLPTRAIWLLGALRRDSDGGTGCNHQVRDFLRALDRGCPHKIHTVLTANRKNHGPNKFPPGR
ncbi:hypothetical protein XH92_37560 [Bradyrhizobium sp. CCBAU 53421]|nr:hypothetical protein XH92_37560 [Bradyrhizobium sp. CCBAU 53421]